jgi:hypothetical protein
VAADYNDALGFLVIFSAAVLVVSSRNTWDLLASVAAAGISAEGADVT